MRLFTNVLVALLALSVNHALTSPLVVHPGGPEDLIINEDDTLNATNTARLHVNIAATTAAGQLDLSLVNNLNSNNVRAYVTGLDSNGRLVMLQPDGSWYYPTTSTASTPQLINANVAMPLGGLGSTTRITLPGYVSAGRVYFADGTLKFYTVQGASGPSLVEPSAVNPSDPSANINWGFVELTNTAGGLYANISYVDFVGLPLGMTLAQKTGAIQSAYGVQVGTVAKICANLASQSASDGQPWNKLCMTDSSGKALRVLSPTQYMSIDPTAFSNYWTNYINQVWNYYAKTPLTIDTQAAAGLVNCTVTNNVFTCTGDNRGYAKPTANDIFGCNGGPFAIQ